MRRRDSETKGMTVEQKFEHYGCSERFECLGRADGDRIAVRCRNCGYEFTRVDVFLHRSKNHNIMCRRCGIHADGSYTPPQSEVTKGIDDLVVVGYYLKGNSATQTAKKFGMNLRRVRGIIDRAGVARDKVRVVVEKDYPDGMAGDEWLDEEFVCVECGRTFTRYQRMLHDGSLSKERRGRTFKYCSSKCCTKHQRPHSRQARTKREAGIKGDRIILGDLMERDGGICQICGEAVDIGDGFHDQFGYFHVGRNYPSIDHIIPISKGGEHVWDNVQLAHMACNAGKCDRIA